MKVRSYAATSPDGPLVPWEVVRRPPGDRDVRIRIEHCGICHSDIHFARSEWPGTVYPCVPGHEIVGRVEEVGPSVTKHRKGDLVGVGCLVGSCRACGSCREGLENFCEDGPRWTYGSVEEDGSTPTYGGYATQIVVDEHFVLKVPGSLNPAAAAPLLCAGITTYAPLRHVGLSPGERVAVMGLGGLGHMAVKLAASLGAEVTVFSRSPHKEQDAPRLGASAFVLADSSRPWAPFSGHFHHVIDTISAGHDLNRPLRGLRRDGTLILLGASPEPVSLSASSLIVGRRSLLGSLIGGIPQTQELLDHCGALGITSDVERIPPERINEAYDRTLRGDVRYRFVIDLSAL